jgi:DNA-binding NarL/FixJ family response regulator
MERLASLRWNWWQVYGAHRIDQNWCLQLEEVWGRTAPRGAHVSKHILIVDDSALIRRIIRERLEQQNGWEVSGEAANGREAIEKAQELRPDFIVLDLAMPVMNGLEAARALKRLLPRVPVLMFTNFDAAHLKREALAAGIRAVVSKSGSLESLVSAIQGLLEPAA